MMRPLFSKTVLWLWFISGIVFGQFHEIKFDRIGTDKGLSQNSVTCILQDHRGAVWIGTQDGLNVYDGYQFNVFRHDPDDRFSISDHHIQCLYEDPTGNIWIGTLSGGLNQFDRQTGRFVRYGRYPQSPVPFPDNNISSLCAMNDSVFWVGTFNSGLYRFYFRTQRLERVKLSDQTTERIRVLHKDPQNRLWIGTVGQGLFRYDSDGKIHHYRPDATIKGSRRLAQVWSMTSDRIGRLWVGTLGGGLLYLDTAQFTESTDKTEFQVLNDSYHRPLVNDPRILSLMTDSEGWVWIGTAQDGLYRIFCDPVYGDIQTGLTRHFMYQPADPWSIANNTISSLMQDKGGLIWIGTLGGGICRYDRYRHKFFHVHSLMDGSSAMKSNMVTAFAEDAAGIIWVATDRGIYRYDPVRAEILQPPKGKFPDSRIRSMALDPEGRLWFGTEKGLWFYDPTHHRSGVYVHKADDSNSLSHNTITAVWAAHDGSLWIGTFGGGLNRFDLRSGRFQRFYHQSDDSLSLSHNTVRVVMEDSRRRLWIGTLSGLNLYEPTKKSFHRFMHQPQIAGSLRHPVVLSACEDRSRQLWFGTYGGGLHLYDSLTGLFSVFSQKDGLPNDVIYGIVCDDSNHLWISTNRGLAKVVYDRITQRARIWVFNESDGLQSNEFNAGAYLSSRRGNLYFGGPNGFNVFHPRQIMRSTYHSPVVISRVKVNYETVYPALFRPLSHLDLHPGDFILTVEFASLDFAVSGNLQYQYQLEGFDKNSVFAGNRRSATYTNLDPGDYVFLAKGTNRDGLWSDSLAILRIQVHPPFWKTAWFYILTATLITGTVLGLFRIRIRSIQRQKRRLEKLVEQRTNALNRQTMELSEKNRELELRNRRLEQIDAMVRAINAKIKFEEVLQTIFIQLATIKETRQSGIWIRRHYEHHYRRIAHNHAGGSEPLPEEFPEDEVRSRFLSHPLSDDRIFLVPDPEKHSVYLVLQFDPPGVASTQIADLDPIHGSVEGLLILEYTGHPPAQEDIDTLRYLRAHIVSAFIKSRILSELAELNDKKNEFLGMAAHDLRNPLGGISNLLQVILNDLVKNKVHPLELQEDLTAIYATTRRMLLMVNQLLNLSAIESGKVRLDRKTETLLPLFEDCERFYRKVAAQKQIELLIEKDNAQRMVSIDPVRIHEVLDNLLSNAIKYTYPGGRVRLWIEPAPNELVIHCEDNGQGLSEVDMAHVFTDFQKLSSVPTGGEESTGLGLAIVKKIVELHGGRVWVVSRQGEGARFSFSVPVAS